MRLTLLGLATFVLLSASDFGKSTYAKPPAHESLATAVANLSAWLDGGTNGTRWREYLYLDELDQQLAKGPQADPKVLLKCWTRFTSGQSGLELAQFGAVREGFGNWWQELVGTSPEKLAEVIKEAKDLFVPITAETIARDRRALDSSIGGLDAHLSRIGPNGMAWKKYLLWDDLQAQLGLPEKDQDPAVLANVEKRFSENKPGLELPEFAGVEAALRSYLETLAAFGSDNLKGEFDSHLDGLAADLSAYAAHPDDKAAIALQEHLRWLDTHHQGRLLLQAIQHLESRTNLRGRMSEALLQIGTNRSLDEDTPVNDNILGTAINGKGRTVGQISLEFLPSAARAIIETRLTGVTTTQTVGQNGPATIYSSGATSLNGAARIELDAQGLSYQPPVATAQTNTRINGVATGRGGIVQRIASQRVSEGKAQAEQVAGQHAAGRLRARLTSEIAANVGKANHNYLEEVRNPLLRLHAFPALLQFSTSSDAMFVSALQADMRQLGAPHDSPVKENGDHAMFVQCHDSFVNNLAERVLAGQTLNDEQVKKKQAQLRGPQPVAAKTEAKTDEKEDEEAESWTITFADKRPVILIGGDDGFQITVCGKHYVFDEKPFKAMNVTAVYKIEHQGNTLRLKRDGDLKILPPDFKEGETKYNLKDTTMFSIFRKKFGKLFPMTVENEGIQLQGNWKQAGKLPWQQVAAKEGWFVFGWGMPGAKTAKTPIALKEAGSY